MGGLISLFIFTQIQKKSEDTIPTIEAPYITESKVIDSKSADDDISFSDSPETSGYVVTNSFVLFNGVPFNADPETFEILSDGKDGYFYSYGRDINNVYYEGRTLPSVHVESFLPIENYYGPRNYAGEGWIEGYGTDGETTYFKDMPITGADPETFTVLGSGPGGCTAKVYSRDLYSVYIDEVKIIGADPETFEPIIQGIGKDIHGYYKGVDFIGPTIDPKELVCDFG